MKRFPILTLVIALIFVGCATTQKANSNTESTHPLLLTHWSLQAIDQKPLPETSPKPPFIVFDTNGRYFGNFGCNNFFGSYYQKKKKIELDYTGATKMLCSDMEMEKAFMKAIKRDVNTFSMNKDTLFLFENGVEVMRFIGERKPETVE